MTDSNGKPELLYKHLHRTYCWVECPECKKETDLDWDTLSFAGDFRERVTCSKCGAKIQIIVNVTILKTLDS